MVGGPPVRELAASLPGLEGVPSSGNRRAVPEEDPGRQARLDESVRSVHMGRVAADALPSARTEAAPEAAGKGGCPGLRGEVRGRWCLQHGHAPVSADRGLAFAAACGQGSAH